MAKAFHHIISPNFTRDICLCIASIGATLVFCAIWSFTNPFPCFYTCPPGGSALNSVQEPTNTTFYDDPKVGYTIEEPMINWDEKRRDRLKQHPAIGPRPTQNRVIVLTGSQPWPCKNPLGFGDHTLLRFFKNKVDYCRIHGYDIVYNNAFLHPKMQFYWAKIPLVRAAMVAHPEAEWMFWVDSDAIFTDMDFRIPWERYKDYNMVVHGWPNLIYEKQSWLSLNAGVFLLRNCQWSMDLLDVWARMGPKSPNYKNWGQILKATLKDKMFPDSDDQSALVYLLLKEKEKWGDKIYIENEYAFSGYWLEIVEKLENFSKGVEKPSRRQTEAASESYAPEGELVRRPFITHFTGCEPCSGDHNPIYGGDSCWTGIERALNFADNQVLRSYGFVHPDLDNCSYVEPLLAV